MEITPELLVTGLITGLVYALLASGLVLIYRATRVINFAYAELGALCAAVLAKLVDMGLHFFLALIIATALGAVLGAVIELTVVRRLFQAPRMVLLVATIGVGQVLFLAQLLLPLNVSDARFPSPFGREVFLGDLLLSGKHFLVIAVVPAVVGMLAVFLTRTPHGIAIRAAASNPDAAELAGISSRRVSTMVWAIGGALAALTVVMANPIRGVLAGLPQSALGPGLLLRALAAALVGRLISLPRTLAGGVAIGVVEALLIVNVDNKGAADAVLFVIVLGLLLIRSRRSNDGAEGFVPTPRPRAVPAVLASRPVVRLLPLVSAVLPLAAAVALPFVFASPDNIFFMSLVACMALAAISVTVLIGWSGQLSLGHFAFVGLGSMTTAALVARGLPFTAAVGWSAVVGVVAGVIVGAPALRLKGLFLAVTTLAFAIATSSWLFSLEILRGDASVVSIPRASILGIDLTPQRNYYFLCLIVLAVIAAAVAHWRKTGVGRVIIAVRDNEDRSASLTLSPAFVKLATFGFAAGVAALAGALLGGLRVSFPPTSFGPELSLQMVSIAIIGGLGSVPGAILGTLWVVGLPRMFGDTPEITFLSSGVGLLLLLMYLPGGLVSLVHRARDAILDLIASRTNQMVEAPVASGGVRGGAVLPPRSNKPVQAEPPDCALEATDISLAIDGRPILSEVTIRVVPGETVGIIGANGAGKSTLMNVLSGFWRADAGAIEVFGDDVTKLAAHERARLGVGRIFQDARLFGDLTVTEAVQVALESRERSEFIPSLLALPPSLRAERRKRKEAAEIIAFLGLSRYAANTISSLSTGSRRIVELSCLIAQNARLLLLDEPTAGMAQREAEAFAPLLSRIQDELGATAIIIEHDIPLVSSMSDRLYCLSVGRVIADGTPARVVRDPAVIAAYLGTDQRAIRRTGRAAKRRKPKAKARAR